jgi:Na+(H+)/acetate symporter ActP
MMAVDRATGQSVSAATSRHFDVLISSLLFSYQLVTMIFIVYLRDVGTRTLTHFVSPRHKHAALAWSAARFQITTQKEY